MDTKELKQQKILKIKINKTMKKLIDKLQHFWNKLLYKLMFKKYR
jgi:hypothetical protein